MCDGGRVINTTYLRLRGNEAWSRSINTPCPGDLSDLSGKCIGTLVKSQACSSRFISTLSSANSSHL